MSSFCFYEPICLAAGYCVWSDSERVCSEKIVVTSIIPTTTGKPTLRPTRKPSLRPTLYPASTQPSAHPTPQPTAIGAPLNERVQLSTHCDNHLCELHLCAEDQHYYCDEFIFQPITHDTISICSNDYNDQYCIHCSNTGAVVSGPEVDGW